MEQENVLSYGGLILDLGRREARKDNIPVQLRRKEFDILSIFVRRHREIVTRELILSELPQPHRTSDRTLDSHISRIRLALRMAGALDVIISPVYGMGYKLDWAPASRKAG
jgi:DNA-binding response OmpR family regulator